MSDSVEFSIPSTNELPEAARQLIRFAGGIRHFMFEAPMGAGKTTLIKALCQELGSHDSFSSPSYSLVNQYQSTSGTIYHLDLYRLNSEQELLDIGIEEYLSPGHYCLVEWPEKLLPFLESVYIFVELKVTGNIRYLRASKISP